MSLNLADIVVLFLIGLAVLFALGSILRRRKKGGCCGCSGDCSRCNSKGTYKGHT